MIRLDLAKRQTKPQWHDLGRGVSMELRPLASYEHKMCQHRAGKLLDDFMESSEVLVSFGFPSMLMDGDNDTDYQHKLSGLSQVLIAAFAADLVVSDWRGVGDVQGAPVETSLAAFGMLFQDADFLHSFEAQAYQRLFLEQVEGE